MKSIILILLLISCVPEIIIDNLEQDNLSELVNKYIEPENAYRTNIPEQMITEKFTVLVMVNYIFYDNQDFILIFDDIENNVYVSKEVYNNINVGDRIDVSSIELSYTDLNNKKTKTEELR